jgi:hypothetical protein
MHIEKNIAEALFCTLMDTEKSKDNPKARVDIATLCDRPNLQMRPPEGRKKIRRHKAYYVLSIEQRREVLKWMKTLRFPDGYAHNVKRGVNLTTLRVNGMKSHDYHVWIERLLPTMVRGFVPENIWQVLAALSYSSGSYVRRRYLRPYVKSWRKRSPCYYVSWRKSFHLDSSCQCSI